MSFFFKSERVGKNGRPFFMYKIRTLKEGENGLFASDARYTWYGKFLRKSRIDEIPQLWNVLRGDMNLVGPRPEELRTINLYPEHIREQLLSIKPGLFGLSGLHFLNEERLLQNSEDPQRDYWEKIRPMKLTIDFFYIEHRDVLLDIWIIYKGITKVFFSLFKNGKLRRSC